jgi:hypothetical protein
VHHRTIVTECAFFHVLTEYINNRFVLTRQPLKMATILKTVCHADSKLLEIVFAQHEDVESTTRGPQSYMYPFVWLRDNCQCSSCFQPSATARLLLFKDLDLMDSPLNVKVSMNNPTEDFESAMFCFTAFMCTLWA